MVRTKQQAPKRRQGISCWGFDKVLPLAMTRTSTTIATALCSSSQPESVPTISPLTLCPYSSAHSNDHQQGSVTILKECCTQPTLSIPMVSFQKWIKEIFKEMFGDTEYRIRCAALGALQEETEEYAVRLFQDADICRALSNRVTVMQSDLKLSHRLLKRN